MPISPNWYELSHPELTDSPALLIYPDRVKQNIQTAIHMTGSVDRLRPHVKTSKNPQVIRWMQEAGIYKFKCATISEAEMLAMENAKDVLLAYQPVGPKLERYISLVKQYPNTNFSCLVDNIETAREQVSAFSKAGITPTVYVDLNVGMNRSGIAPGELAKKLIIFLYEQEQIRSVGLHVYDGHIRQSSLQERELEVAKCFEKVESLIKELESAGFSSPHIIAGGSPTFPVHAKRNLEECSPGTFIYWDKTYSDAYPEQQFLHAAVVLCRVISNPDTNLITVDLGHKSIASENEISKRVFFPGENDLVPVSHSEEHLVLKNNSGKTYKPGDVLFGIPYHICPTVALYEKALTVEGGEVTGEYRNAARDRRIIL
jgi:D-serine deaminase-like pyridoxal phosphate-dependent protein